MLNEYIIIALTLRLMGKAIMKESYIAAVECNGVFKVSTDNGGF